ncbi:MAG: hypothetical protein ACYC8T_32910 [Myxococcaceae bacterium]
MRLLSATGFWLIAIVSWAAGAPAAPAPRARLVYSLGAGAERCPDEQTVRDAVSGRLGYDPFREPAEMEVRVAVERADPGLSARLELRDAGGRTMGKRQLASRASDCVELASALGLAVSIAIDPLSVTRPPPVPPAPAAAATPPAPPPPAPPPALSPSVQTAYTASLGAVASVGTAPAPALGANLQLGARWPSWSLALEGRMDLPASRSTAGGQVASSLLVGSLVPCLHRRAVAGCALLTAGVFQGSGVDFVGSRRVTTPFLAAGARALAELPLAEPFSLRLHADFLAPLVRTTLLVGESEAFSAWPVSVTFGLAAAARLP